MDIFVTGMGTINSIGLTVDESMASLKSEKPGMAWSPDHNLMLGKIHLSNDKLRLILDGDFSTYSRTTLLGMHSAKEAWGNNQKLDTVRTGFISSTSVGELDISETIYGKAYNNQAPFDLNSLVQEAGNTSEQIADYVGIRGYINTISTACSSGANAILLGARLIQSGRFDRMLVGGIDPLCTHNMKGFHALNICDNDICKPFDKDRNGLNLGEGAAYVLLENENSTKITNNKALCRLSGWANTADAFHQTATSPDGRGAISSMERALEKAQLKPSDIDYINAHGTGTVNNDLSESNAIQHVFGKSAPLFSSTKSFTGHTLAAAGAIEAVFCIRAIQDNFIPVNLGFTNGIDEVDITPVNTRTKKNVKHVLSNSFGFGGNCSTLIFSQL